MKVCSHCNTQSPYKMFHKNKNSKDGYSIQCKVCIKLWRKARYLRNKAQVAIINREYRIANPDKVKQWNKEATQRYQNISPTHRSDLRIKGRYGITPIDWLCLYYIQDEKCPICDKHLSLNKRQTVVDHCHKTDKVRGLLCQRCNLTLGYYESIIDRKVDVNKVAEYLQPKWSV